MKKPHVFWILIDSARNFPTDEDTRGLPQSVVDFAKSSLHFENVITSAPSTIQSISSMMTSSPSYLLSRSYNNYRGKLDCFDYFPSILKANGYQVFGAIYFKHGREVMSDVFGLIENKYFPKEVKHRNEVWTNQDVFKLFCNIVDKYQWDKPTMCYLHYNVRVDTNVSGIVEDTLEKIKSKGLLEDSIIVINSDHGYPVASRNYNFEEGLKQGWGHDKYMTNDNILTPLVIRYPGVVPEKVTEYAATIDIVPTLCDLVGIPVSQKFHGKSLVGERTGLRNRFIRTDNRYVGQLPSYNSYIKGNQKAIIYKSRTEPDEVTFYNLDADPNEENGTTDPTRFERFYQEFLKDEWRLNNFHRDYLIKKWTGVKSQNTLNNISSVCIVLKSTPAFRQIAREAIQTLFPDAEIEFYDKASQQEYDLKIFIIESEIPWEFKSFNALGDSIQAKQTIYLDNNGRIFGKRVLWALYRSFIGKRYALIKHDKIFVFDLLKRMLRKRLLKPIK